VKKAAIKQRRLGQRSRHRGVIAEILGKIKGPGLSAGLIIEGIHGGLPIQDLNVLNNLGSCRGAAGSKLAISRATP
jgi:hypothetical protein